MARLHARAFETERPWSADEFCRLQSSPSSLVLGDSRAMIVARVIVDEAEILTLATDPDHRRQGLARALLEDFHRAAQERGAETAFLEVAADNAPARALYLAAGYTESGRRRGYYPREGGPAVDALLLSRALDAPAPGQS
ncbi:GNAT family N-acetyltransferase [Histidinibacterium aquaticum]|uniref:GNAT family N-acetyltransferase n=2 Tax=Histidinibacterium aquaticum TaxID=2613962 RepID=A0A5J5GB28_9RHOB|nr:GNAT family N-acetyltransferase [Histidinibacterium aquaticum]